MQYYEISMYPYRTCFDINASQLLKNQKQQIYILINNVIGKLLIFQDYVIR